MRRLMSIFSALCAENICIFTAKCLEMAIYIHERPDWPHFTYDQERLMSSLGSLKLLQGKLLGKVELLGFHLKDEANLETLIQDVVKSSEIEGETIRPELVRSSIAIKLGLEDSGLPAYDRDIEGVVEMTMDATQNNNKVLNEERLFGWHAALFPYGRSGMHKIEVAQWRTGEMQVVSGGMGRENIHFRAPSPERVPKEMTRFMTWFNTESGLDPVLKAAIAHLWFVTIHPFDDGNGRIARAIADMQLSIADGVNQRFYSMSAQIRKERKAYYAILESTQRGDTDVTDWMLWFLNCLKEAIVSSEAIMNRVMKKHHFWIQNSHRISNDRQRMMLNRLMDHFEGHLTTTKWAKMTRTSPDTALRDITDLLNKGILLKAPSGGRSTHYLLNW